MPRQQTRVATASDGGTYLQIEELEATIASKDALLAKSLEQVGPAPHPSTSNLNLNLNLNPCYLHGSCAALLHASR
jgi:hypothetical protein